MGEGVFIDIRLDQIEVGLVGTGPVQLHRGDHIELLEARVVLGADHLQVGDRMGTPL